MNLKQRLFDWIAGAPKTPQLRKVSVLMQACNLACPMCSMNVNNDDVDQILRDYPRASHGPQLRLNEYKAFLKAVSPYKPVVSFGGGEPFIFPYLLDLFEYAVNELQLGVGVTTNATLFKPGQLERLVRLPISITISVDGLGKTHDDIRGEGMFDLTISELRRLVDLKRRGGHPIQIHNLCAIQPENHLQCEGLADFLVGEIGVDGMTFSNLLFTAPETLAQHEEWVATRALPDIYKIKAPRGGLSGAKGFADFDFEAHFAMKQRILKKYSNIRFEPDFSSLEFLKKYYLTNEIMSYYFSDKCRPSNDTMTLISNGDILFFPQCFQIKIGNIRESSPDEIWQSTLFAEIRKVLAGDLSPVCAHCCANRREKEFSQPVI